MKMKNVKRIEAIARQEAYNKLTLKEKFNKYYAAPGKSLK